MSVLHVDNLTLPAAATADTHSLRISQLRERHWTMLLIATAVMIVALSLHTNSSGQVGPTSLPGVWLPELCGSRALFGIECPGCGLTRSFIVLAHGDSARSLTYHRVGWLLALAVVMQFPYRILLLRELRFGAVERNWPTWFGWLLIATLVSNWLTKVAGLS